VLRLNEDFRARRRSRQLQAAIFPGAKDVDLILTSSDKLTQRRAKESRRWNFAPSCGGAKPATFQWTDPGPRLAADQPKFEPRSSTLKTSVGR